MNKAYEKIVGERIRDLRENINMTQEQLSAKLQTLGCDLTRSAVAKIEVGQRHIYLDEIKAIATIFKTSIDDILI